MNYNTEMLLRWQRLSAASLRAFHAYANWLVSISWWRFALLSVLLMTGLAILQNIPPFTWRFTETVVEEPGSDVTDGPKSPKPPAPPRRPLIKIEKADPAASGSGKGGIDITINDQGVVIVPHAKQAASAASAPASAASATSKAPFDGGIRIDRDGVQIRLPGNSDNPQVREAVEEAHQAILDAVREAEDAKREAEAAKREAQAERELAQTMAREAAQPRKLVHVTHFGDVLPELGLLWILVSLVTKITYKGRVKAEEAAAQATETAEAESLKRQVVEARMAAMQAQVEPHFLFNTLASIDHLIETDPPKASIMQKNLIALLRASMPTMREANASGVRDLGRELAVIQPYLEILKVRMEDRLQTQIDVPEGLRSAEFPPMMIQSLVENAIKHGLEPKPEGGSLVVRAEILHGKLAVTVADTGLGFGRAATAGTGIGLHNIRERLQLLYGGKASLTVRENTPSGTSVTISVPYVARQAEGEMA